MIPAAACDILDELRGRIRFGVHLVIYLGNTVRIGDAGPDRPLHSEHDLMRHPHASAAGKLLLAHLADWRTAVSGLAQLTEHTIIEPERLEAELDTVRRTDLACQTGELSNGLACVATPVRSRTEQVVGAVCIAGPANRATALAGHVEAARAAADSLSSLIA